MKINENTNIGLPLRNLIRDLKKQIDERRKQESAKVQLRKRSMDSISRPKATKNITSKDPRLQGI